MRDDFNNKMKETLARRVGLRCSNPQCRKPTTGPRTQPTESINIGVAAHITAAAPGGPRFDKMLPQQERKAIENAIWLCQNCAKLVDNDGDRYTVAILRHWKKIAEELTLKELETSTSCVAAPGSVSELITVIEIRAAAVLNKMEEVTTTALVAFKKETQKERKVDQKQKYSKLDKIDRVEALSAKLPEYGSIRLRWKYADEQQLLAELNLLKDKFVSLHHQHKFELIKGNYIAAHEIVGQIHSLIEQFNKAANPPYPPYPGISLGLRYCIRRPSSEERYRRLVEKPQHYPGAITKELANLLPDSLVGFYLINGDKFGNTRKALKWDEEEKRRWFTEIIKSIEKER